MEQCIKWRQILVAVVLQAASGDPKDGVFLAMKIFEEHLKDVIGSAARDLGLTSSSYEEANIPVQGRAESVRGWNITNAALLQELLRMRADGSVNFNLFYRRCDGTKEMKPGSDFFSI